MAIDPFSALGIAWTVGTSFARVLQWKDEDKQVDGEWLAASGFEKVCRLLREDSNQSGTVCGAGTIETRCASAAFFCTSSARLKAGRPWRRSQ